MKFGFVAKHRGVWPVRWLCGVSIGLGTGPRIGVEEGL